MGKNKGKARNGHREVKQEGPRSRGSENQSIERNVSPEGPAPSVYKDHRLENQGWKMGSRGRT